MGRAPPNPLAKRRPPRRRKTPGDRIAAETRQGDVYFVPNPLVADTDPRLVALGELMASLVRVPRLFEIYRRPVTADDLQESGAKTLDWRAVFRQTPRPGDEAAAAAPLPELCVLTPTLSPARLRTLGAVERPGGPAGVYLVPGPVPMVVVVVHQLPVEPATLWFRLLGRDGVQRQALRELEALPATHPLRHDTIRAIAAYRQRLQQQRTPLDPDDRQVLRHTQRLDETWERETIARGEAKGKAEAVLAILEARGLVVKAAQRKQIVATTDLGQLEAWVRAAVTVASVDALLSPPARRPSPRRKAAPPRT